MGFDRVPQWLLGQHLIVILATDFLTLNEARCLQIVDDSLDSSFGDANPVGDFAQNQFGLGLEQDQHMRVIGQESPAVRGARGG